MKTTQDTWIGDYEKTKPTNTDTKEEETQVKGPENIFNKRKILKAKEIPIEVEGTYRISNTQAQKRNSPWDLIKTPVRTEQRKDINSCKGKRPRPV